MRLINVNDCSLSEFIGRTVPQYAILSHTWGDDEVSFKDIQNLNAARSKAGFKKIDLCCKQAKEDHFEWVWVDTCCIDKTSSAELSEAINSMFRWYSEAMVCYAYLSDVSISYNDKPEDFDLGTLRKSRWFTRGWTLQELLAPLTVQFFTRSWSYIGSKKQLAPLLSEITGISVKILDHSLSPLDQTVYDRMHWASRRQTTREEDKAYCLLGLFDINMPLLYGEGKKAFHRLQEEIIKNFDDHTIFLWDLHPTKGLPEGEVMLVLKTGIYGGLFANSPHQFSNKADIHSTAASPEQNKTIEPIQVTRKGSLIRLYLKKVTPKTIASWPDYAIDGHLCEFYLAALDCLVMNNNYIAEPTIERTENDGPECTAMLLLRHPSGPSYERVYSYYETVSWQDVKRFWKYTACYIKNPIWQWFNYTVNTLSNPPNKLNLRWSGPTFGYTVVKEFIDEGLSAFLLAQSPRSPDNLPIMVVYSMLHQEVVLDARWQEDWTEAALRGILAEYNGPDRGGITEKRGTGPMLETVFRANNKELVLTLSVDEVFDSPQEWYSARNWTLWLSFRLPAKRSINEAVMKAISEQVDLGI
jgi:hypothetical protein